MAVAAAEKAVRCLGRGFDMTCDMRLKYCKDTGGCLVERSGVETAPLAVPGVGTICGVPVDVKCGKGDRVRLKSDVLEFNKMSELFNQRSSVEGKIPSGLFNACFDLDSGSWAKDAAATKCLAMDGYFISLFDLRLDRCLLALADHVRRDVPAAWDPATIARSGLIWRTKLSESVIDRKHQAVEMSKIRCNELGQGILIPSDCFSLWTEDS